MTYPVGQINIFSLIVLKVHMSQPFYSSYCPGIKFTKRFLNFLFQNPKPFKSILLHFILSAKVLPKMFISMVTPLHS